VRGTLGARADLIALVRPFLAAPEAAMLARTLRRTL
jgi:hypothetical protein